MEFSPDLAALYAEFGQTITLTATGSEARGYFTAPAADALGGAGISNDYAVEMAAGSLPGLAPGASLTIAGAAYQVREIWPIDDGSVHRITLRKV